MNWIDNYVRPKINSLFSRREVPENLWRKCDACGTMLFHRELADALNTCPNCRHHMHITPRDRFSALYDGGLFVEVEVPEPIADPLQFRDEKRYTDRMKDARRKTGEAEAMLVVKGDIFGLPTICAGQDFSFMAGSMGIAVGNAMLAAAEAAVKEKAPLVVFSAAGGARMQESSLSLMQMGKTSAALARLDDAGGLFISVLTDPTTGGVTASFAMLGDVILAEREALIGFAGPRVIANTVRQDLPEGFQRAEFLQEKGFVDRVVHRHDLRSEVSRVIDYAGK